MLESTIAHFLIQHKNNVQKGNEQNAHCLFLFYDIEETLSFKNEKPVHLLHSIQQA